MKRIYLTDLDGTLLRGDGTLSPRSRRVLEALLTEGLTFTVATARSIASIRQVLGDLPLSCPVVESNGAFITDYASGRHEAVQAFLPSLAAELLARGRGLGQAPFLAAFDGRRDRLFYTEASNPGLRWYLRDRLRAGDGRLARLEQPEQALEHQLVCFIFIDRRETLSALAAELKRDLSEHLELYLMDNSYSPGWCWLTVYDRSAGKHNAAARLIRRLGFGPEQLVAFGDQDNDLGLLRLAARGIAVANAAPGLKAAADRVIGSNEEDGVVRYLLAERRAGRQRG
jgi:Cof subfamily protein (haloacid dehalogenase superfamily)